MLNNYWKYYSLLFLAFCISFSVKSQDASASYNALHEVTKYDSTNWLFELPLWVPGFKGAFTVGDIKISGENTDGIFNKLFDSKYGLDFYLVGKVRYATQKWRFQADIFGGKINNSVAFKYGSIDISNTNISTIIPRFFVGYKLYSYNLNKKYNNNLNIWINAGLRNYNVYINSELTGIGNAITIRDNWVEPIIGIGIPFYYKGWAFSYYTDIGGFSINSKLSWWMQLHGRYQFDNRFALNLGWVVQDIYYKSIVNETEFKYNVRLSGPMAGLAIFL